MKKDVLINIKGIYRGEGDSDVVELFTTGQYYKRDGHYYISYEESEATGFEGSRTTLKVEPDRDTVTLSRTGTATTEIIVERGVRHQCHYDIGVGDMMIGVMGNRIKSSLTDSGGKLEFKYSMDINSLLTSENEMYINVKTM